jgi:hypothetical protein
MADAPEIEPGAHSEKLAHNELAGASFDAAPGGLRAPEAQKFIGALAGMFTRPKADGTEAAKSMDAEPASAASVEVGVRYQILLEQGRSAPRARRAGVARSGANRRTRQS